MKIWIRCMHCMEVKRMLFSEVYGAYFNVLAEILGQAAEGTLTKEGMEAIIRRKGFEESILSIGQNLEDETWPLLKPDMTTPLMDRPTMPLTELQKRWMKALVSDPRLRLFDPPMEGLEGVEPLYPADAFVYFDRYGDGDPYEDPGYIRHFQTILAALREKRLLKVSFLGGTGIEHCWHCIPYRLEYSPKDDKFRLITTNKHASAQVNLARITHCELLEPWEETEYVPRMPVQQVLELELIDERNALERCLFHFSHLEKETERIDDRRYRLTLRYDSRDETEMLIRVMSFGAMLKVIAPDSFREQLVSRVRRQMRKSEQKPEN